MAWTSDDLVTQVLRLANVATGRFGSTTETAAFIRACADEVIATRVWPTIRMVKEDYGLKTHDITITAGTAKYRLPRRASGAALKNVFIVGSDSVTRRLTHVPYNRKHNISNAGNQGTPIGFSIEGDRVELLPTPDASATLRLAYYLRPSTLVAVSACGEIDSAVDDAGNVTIGVSSVPSGFPAAATSAYYDVVQESPNFDLLVVDVGGLRDNSPTDEFIFTTTAFGATAAAEIESDISLLRTNYLCLAGETPVVPCPVELQHAVYRMTAGAVLASDGDAAASSAMYAIGQEELDRCKPLLSPRIDGEKQPLINHSSALRSRRGWPS